MSEKKQKVTKGEPTVSEAGVESGLRAEAGVESGSKTVQPNGGTSTIEIKRGHFPADPPDNGKFDGQKDYEWHLQHFLGQKLTITKELEAAAKSEGYSSYLESFVESVLDD